MRHATDTPIRVVSDFRIGVAGMTPERTRIALPASAAQRLAPDVYLVSGTPGATLDLLGGTHDAGRGFELLELRLDQGVAYVVGARP